MTRFYIIKKDRVLTGEFKEDDLGKGRLSLSPLFHKAHELITVIRLIEEKRRGEPDGSDSAAKPNLTQSRLVDENLLELANKMLHAATTGDADGLRALLKTGISANVSDQTGLTPLMASSYAGETEALRLLLDSGAQIDATDTSGYTALMFACNSGQKSCAELLIERGADINHRDKDESTPIMFAAQHARSDIVTILLACGADPKFQGKHGLSAIGFARQNGHSEIERILTRGQ
jgi:ankyrin repeat protein